MSVDINYLAVFLAGVSAMVVGSLWYSPLLYGKAWRKTYVQDDAKARREGPYVMSIVFVFALVMAYVLAHLAFIAHSFFRHTYLQDTMTTALWLWLGVSLPAVLGGLFEQRRKVAIAIHAANIFVTLMVMALIIGLMGT